MVRSTGVEPVTARFVAEYSIQLSYERITLCLTVLTFFYKQSLAVKKCENYEV